MYGSRKGLAVLIGVFLITGFFSVSSASSVIQHGRSGNDPFFGLMHKLNLTAAQKAESSGYTQVKRADCQDYSDRVGQRRELRCERTF